MKKELKNTAFIDGQNLWLGTSKVSKDGEIIESSWLDLKKFRIYLKEKYKVEKAYYFLGVVDENYNF